MSKKIFFKKRAKQTFDIFNMKAKEAKSGEIGFGDDNLNSEGVLLVFLYKERRRLHS